MVTHEEVTAWRGISQAITQARKKGPASQSLACSDVAERAQRLYDSELKDKLEPHRNGQFVVINADNLDYEIDQRDMTATLRMLQRDPTCGPLLFGIRIGFRAAYHLRHVPRETRE